MFKLKEKRIVENFVTVLFLLLFSGRGLDSGRVSSGVFLSIYAFMFSVIRYIHIYFNFLCNKKMKKNDFSIALDIILIPSDGVFSSPCLQHIYIFIYIYNMLLFN